MVQEIAHREESKNPVIMIHANAARNKGRIVGGSPCAMVTTSVAVPSYRWPKKLPSYRMAG